MGQLYELAAVRERRRGQEPPKTKKEIAEHFKVTERTITRWMQRGLPYDKPFEGGSVRFNMARCMDWFTRHG
jgi:phage terminase Nu1 subunit (DNA packaging protein)